MQWVHDLKSKGSFLYHDIIQHKSKKSPRIAFNKQVESAPLNWGAMQRLPCSAAVYKGVIPWWSPLSMSADASSKECRMSRCPFLEWARISESRTCHAFCFAINWVELNETLVSWAFRGELHLTYEGIWSILEIPRAFAGEIERHPSGMYDILIYIYIMSCFLGYMIENCPGRLEFTEKYQAEACEARNFASKLVEDFLAGRRLHIFWFIHVKTLGFHRFPVPFNESIDSWDHSRSWAEMWRAVAPPLSARSVLALASNKWQTTCPYGKWPFMVDLPSKNYGDFPEGNLFQLKVNHESSIFWSPEFTFWLMTHVLSYLCHAIVTLRASGIPAVWLLS